MDIFSRIKSIMTSRAASLSRSNAAAMAGVFLASALVSAFAYPEIFTVFKTSFVVWYDYCVEYPLTFVLTNFLYQGGLQLWNMFGQIPFAHTYGVVGLFKLPNVVTALAYYVLEPFTSDSGRLFHHVFAWGNLMTLLFVRVAGIYLLLKTVTANRWILTAGTMVFAVFFSQFAFLRGEFYMSCFALGMYFIVRFFQEMHWRYVMAFALFVMTGIGSGVLMAGYLYLPLHFLIVAGIVWKVFFRRGDSPASSSPTGRSDHGGAVLTVAVAAAFILAPYAYLVKFGFPELAFDQEHSRISQMFSPQWYFQTQSMDTRLGFLDILNMQTVMTSFSLYYAGWTFLALAMMGVIWGGNRLKWLYVLALVLLLLLGMPRDHWNVGLVAHWINVLTNPLKTLPRSYQNACQPMIPFLLMPLAAMGVEAVIGLCVGKKYSRVSYVALGAAAMVLALANVFSLPAFPRIYVSVCTALLLMAIAWIAFRGSKNSCIFLTGILCCTGVMDVGLIVYQTKKELTARCEGKPVVLDASPTSGLVGYDFANPSIFPFRQSYTLHFSFKDEIYLWFPQGPSSHMRHVVNQALNFTYLNGYNPRHAEFGGWLNDRQMLPYLGQGREFIFLADVAIKESRDGLSRIAQAGMVRRVAMVADDANALHLPDQWPEGLSASKQDPPKYKVVAETLAEGSFRATHSGADLTVFSFKLPSYFPDHLATSWFPAEQPYLRFLVKQKGEKPQEFVHAQGELIRPGTFDVQNIKKGMLLAAFPRLDRQPEGEFALLYPSPDNEGVQEVWRKQFDHLGLTYHAQKSGWLVCHYPYDPKFRIAVDGKPVAYYRTNKSFIGFPLTKGTHKILIEYWPGSWLRPALLLSALITSIGFLVLIVLGLRWEKT